ncbi:MAG: DUF748 domain-containing protein, partial [Candidatus Omnitrophota bacterium]
YFFILTQGKAIVVSQLEKLLKRKVNVESVEIKFPLLLKIHGIDIQGFGQVKDLEIKPDILSILMGKPALGEIKLISPRFHLEIKPKDQGAPEIILPTSQTQESQQQLQVSLKKKSQNFLVKEVKIKDGYIKITDWQVKETGLTITIIDLNINVKNLNLPLESGIIHFNLEASIPWQYQAYRGSIFSKGWIDFSKKNIEAKLNIEDIDGVYLLPYYGKNLSLDKLNIEKGKLSFLGDIKGVNNEVIANCHLELKELVFKQPEEEILVNSDIEKAKKIVATVLEVFRAVSGEIVLDFVIKTKLDKPRFNIESLRMAAEEKISKNQKSFFAGIKPVIELPKNFLIETFNIPKGALLATANMGVGLKKGVIDNVVEDYRNNSKTALEKAKHNIDLQDIKDTK